MKTGPINNEAVTVLSSAYVRVDLCKSRTIIEAGIAMQMLEADGFSLKITEMRGSKAFLCYTKRGELFCDKLTP